MLHQTKAIILRTVAYGDSSLIVTAYTEKFGLQQYLVKGARRVSKKGGTAAGMYQPAALLDMVVYHHPQKQLNYTKEVKWATIYAHVLSQVVKNAVALMMMELVWKCLKETEQNEELFDFVMQYLILLDEAEPAVVANMPLHFLLHFAGQLGFSIENNFSPNTPILDLAEGRFTAEVPPHANYLTGPLAETTSTFLATKNAVTLYRIRLHRPLRQELLAAYQQFFELHLPGFGHLKTIAVLEAVLG